MNAPDERTQAIKNLASALQRCLDISSSAAEKVADRAAEKAANRVKDELMPRLDRQDDTLRLMWKQMKGNGKLPIDD